jgi:hypothetical protein
MELRVGGKYNLSRKLGSGAFGEVYLGTFFTLTQQIGINIKTNEETAIKMEPVKSKHP